MALQESHTKEIFESFYDKLLLRDLFGKVVPGVLLILAILIAAFGPSGVDIAMSKMTFSLWIILGGFSWLTGFALQYLGEAAKLLRKNPYGNCNPRQTRDSFYPIWAVFQKRATKFEKIHAERLNIIKEACGNAAVSLIAGASVVSLSFWWHGNLLSFPEIPLLVLISILAFCFWRMHVIHVERYGELVCRTVTALGAESAD